MSVITDRIGQHEVLLLINHNFNKICEKCSFLFKTQEIPIINFIHLFWHLFHLTRACKASFSGAASTDRVGEKSGASFTSGYDVNVCR